MSKTARLNDKDFEAGYEKASEIRDTLRRCATPEEAASAYDNFSETANRLSQAGISNVALIAGMAACIGEILTSCAVPSVDLDSLRDGVALFVRDHFDITDEAAEMEQTNAVKH